MSDTPKTDAALKDATSDGKSANYGLGYMTEICRGLERERARLAEALQAACHSDADGMTLERGMRLLKELGEL